MATNNAGSSSQSAVQPATTAHLDSGGWLKVVLGPILGAILGVIGAFITMEMTVAQMRGRIHDLESRFERVREAREDEVKANRERIVRVHEQLQQIMSGYGTKFENLNRDIGKLQGEREKGK